MASPPFPDFKMFPEFKPENMGHLAEAMLIGYNPDTAQYSPSVLLSFCPNIVDLALWVVRIRSILPVLNKLPLRRLGANLDDLMYEDLLIQPLFVNLTHLEMFSFIGEIWNKQFEALVHLPNLTHLSIHCSIKVDVIPQLLEHCHLLRILIIALWSPYRYFQRDRAEERIAKVNDHRLVYLETLSFLGLIHDWARGAHGGIDCWAFSELVSFAKSRASFSFSRAAIT